MAIKLLNESDKKYKFTLTKNPMTNTRQSPQPLGYTIESLDEKAVDYRQKKEAVLKHPNYSESEEIVLKPGINILDNDEHAEYIYMTLGNPESGGTITVGMNEKIDIINNNFVWEVDTKGEKVKGRWFEKYRAKKGVQVNTQLNPNAFKLQE